MAYKADEVKVGLVIVVSLLILAGFIVSILGLQIGRPTDSYTTALRFAGGIEPGTPVRFGGMQVGRVAAVNVLETDNTRIQLTMSIDKDTPVKADSEVFINTIGFLGDYYLEISTGSQDKPLLPPGSEIKGRELPSLYDMIARAQSAIEKVDATLVILNDKVLTEDVAALRERIQVVTEKMAQLLADVDTVFDQENRENIRQTLLQVRMLVQENREDVHATVANLRTASERMQSLAASLDSIVGENREDIESLIHEIQTMAGQMQSAAEEIDRLVAENADGITTTVQNLRITSENARDFSETISDEPWRLIWRTRQPEKKPIEDPDVTEHAQ
ncbi:MAG: MCE family protein [Candidatus Abyssobacteria bacterium SURF_17]|jgi:phospholipid/cholesterol/gamma-HCH transport system substrate-binding protein|uniref:MCE family protein n=1 Tax=Candidatus Abyssobacteria bacterium SURF_17 TaxID=2093361 RepID=A0A419EP79_9BACT|nr:MAG: MCE family protein [Candidatus Abyssubacteria bacterium SURF_17]